MQEDKLYCVKHLLKIGVAWYHKRLAIRMSMKYNQVLMVFMDSLTEVFPESRSRKISSQDSLRDLGANSIDRAEIIMLTLSRLKLKIPLVNFGGAKNIGELVDIFYQHLPG